MKTRNIILIILIFIISGACNSFLDVAPDNRTILDSPEAVKELLVSAYPQAHYYHITEVMSDNVGEKGSSGSHDRELLNYDMYTWGDATGTNQDNPIYVWANLYKSIAAANIALETIEEMGDTQEYQSAKGEALLCRAFSHFILVNIFAEHYHPEKAKTLLGIPYMTEPEKKALEFYSRETLQKTYDLIEDDLLKGLPLIRDNEYDVPKYHFTKVAANAFAARFYQYKGDWKKVVSHANIALGDNPRSKIRNLKGPQFNHSDKDVYQKNYFGSDQSSPLLMVSALSWWARDYSSSRLPFGLVKSIHTELFSETVCGTNFSTPTYYISSSSSSNDGVYMRKFEELFKYSSVGSSSGKGYVVSALLSVEEALLNRAEAYIMLDEFELALEDINLLLSERVKASRTDPSVDFTPLKVDLQKIKNYYDNKPELYHDLEPFYIADISADQMSMLKCVVDWRRKEFMQEGLRWFDIKRFYIPVVHEFSHSKRESITLTKNDLRRAVQIPSEAQGFGVEPNPR